MITPLRREVLRGLETLLELSSPDIRVGQLVAWLGFLSEDMDGRSIWDVEDEDLLPVIERFRKDLEARLTDGTEKPVLLSPPRE
jgi:hypothetical protein